MTKEQNDKTHHYSEYDYDDIFSLEKNNSRRIERLENDVNEIRQDIAAMPGMVVTELERRHPASEKFNAVAWAFGVMLTLLGAISWNFYSTDTDLLKSLNSLNDKFTSHSSDGHPLRVEEKIDTNRQAIREVYDRLLVLKTNLSENALEDSQDHANIEARVKHLEDSYQKNFSLMLLNEHTRGRFEEIIIELRRDFDILREGQKDRFTGEEANRLRDKMDQLQILLNSTNDVP